MINRWPEIRQLFKDIHWIVNPSGSPGSYLRLTVGSLSDREIKINGLLSTKKQYAVSAKMALIQGHLVNYHLDTCPTASVLIEVRGSTPFGPVPAAPVPQIPPPPPPMVPSLPPNLPPSTNDNIYTV
jgi:hypothetical protein